MPKQNLVFLIFCFVFYLSGNAQSEFEASKPSDTTSIGKLALYDLQQSIKGVGHAFSRPFHWKGKDFKTLGTVALGSFMLSTIDDESSDMFIRNESNVPDFFQEFGFRFGKPQIYFITNAALYTTGLLTRNEKLRKTSVLIISSSVTTGVIQSLSKTAFGRARPGGDYNSTEFRFWSNEAAFHSFPSGHTVLSMTMAHAIAKQFENPWSKIGVYAVGSIAPISRLFAGAHWLTDVGLAAALSIVVVDSIDKFLFQSKAYKHDKKEKQITWNFSFSGNRIGLTGRF